MVLGVRGIPNVQGGVETHAEQLYARLAELGCEVEVIVRSPFVSPEMRSVGRVRLRRIWSPQRPGLEALLHSLLGVCYAGLSRPDLLHIHAIGPAIVTPIARLFGLRVVVTHHGPDYDRDKWGTFARFVLRLGERFGMRTAHARIAISRVIADLIRSRHSRDATLIPNGVTCANPLPSMNSLSAYGLVPRKYFLQVSRMVPEKRQLDLIEAFAQARPQGWQLVLVGALADDAYSAQVRNAATAGVVLTGYLNGAPLQQMYSHAGAFVLPSSHEGLPIVLLEALSFGLPVIASNIPANLELGLEPSSYFPVGSIPDLAHALRRISEHEEDARARFERTEWVARHYDWDKIARQTLAVYAAVLHR